MKAVDEFAAAEKKFGESEPWMLILHAGALEKQGKEAEAIADYTRFIDRCPNKSETPMIYLVRGSAYSRMGEYARDHDYSASIRLAPDKFAGDAHKAWLLATCSDPKRARRQFSRRAGHAGLRVERLEALGSAGASGSLCRMRRLRSGRRKTG